MSAFPNIAPKKVAGDDLYSTASMWGSPDTWREAVRTVDHLIRLHRPALGRAAVSARDVSLHLESVFPLLDDLCSATCPWCPDPCCLAARVWIDFKDLLFLHLSEERLPPVQMLRNNHTPCRYLGDKGCTLPRIARPWICTWYLCPTQQAALRRKSKMVQNGFNNAVQGIKIGRNNMEAEFIRVVS